MLFMPGANARALDKARSLPCDGIIMDLEDAVAPDAKALARRQVAEAVERGGYAEREIVVRVNGVDSPWFRDDVDTVARLTVDAVLVPKVESADTLKVVREALPSSGAAATLPVWAMIETPRGVLRVDEICGADARLACLVLGTSDLAKELRTPHTTRRWGLLGALSWCVLAARAHGLEILDGVQLDLADDEALEAVCLQGRDLGFDGKTLIHPRQIDIANRVFAPSAKAVQDAERVIQAWQAARDQGSGVAVVEGRLVEALHVEEAQRTLTLASAIEHLHSSTPTGFAPKR